MSDDALVIFTPSGKRGRFAAVKIGVPTANRPRFPEGVKITSVSSDMGAPLIGAKNIVGGGRRPTGYGALRSGTVIWVLHRPSLVHGHLQSRGANR